ncbi:MAG: hypothetical protein K2K34_02670 [Oscillospiraceae bacterium]|nr:hypothetical protein [Oscillospiraceae bacterium]
MGAVDFGSGDIQAALGAGTIDCGFGLIDRVPDSYDVNGDDFTEVAEFRNPLLANRSAQVTPLDISDTAGKYTDSCCG